MPQGGTHHSLEDPHLKEQRRHSIKRGSETSLKRVPRHHVMVPDGGVVRRGACHPVALGLLQYRAQVWRSERCPLDTSSLYQATEEMTAVRWLFVSAWLLFKPSTPPPWYFERGCQGRGHVGPHILDRELSLWNQGEAQGRKESIFYPQRTTQCPSAVSVPCDPNTLLLIGGVDVGGG